jgi:hypothetical protein
LQPACGSPIGYLHVDGGGRYLIAQQDGQTDNSLVTHRADLERNAIRHRIHQRRNPVLDKVNELDAVIRVVECAPILQRHRLKMRVEGLLILLL